MSEDDAATYAAFDGDDELQYSSGNGGHWRNRYVTDGTKIWQNGVEISNVRSSDAVVAADLRAASIANAFPMVSTANKPITYSGNGKPDIADFLFEMLGVVETEVEKAVIESLLKRVDEF